MSLLPLLLFITIAVIYPLLFGIIIIVGFGVIFLMPLILIIQTIYIYRYMKERYNEDSEVKGSLGIKYIQIIIFVIGIRIMFMCMFYLYMLASFNLLYGNWNVAIFLEFLMYIIVLYIWSRIFVIPYAIIIDAERNSILKSLKITKGYSGKIIFVSLLFGILNYALLTIVRLINFGNLLIVGMIIICVYWVIMSIFINVFYINVCERLKEFQDEKNSKE